MAEGNGNIEELKKQIDAASYKQLLRLWRFADMGNNFFLGEIGVYYKKVMGEKGNALSAAERASISKEIGWTKTGNHDKL